MSRSAASCVATLAETLPIAQSITQISLFDIVVLCVDQQIEFALHELPSLPNM